MATKVAAIAITGYHKRMDILDDIAIQGQVGNSRRQLFAASYCEHLTCGDLYFSIERSWP